MINARKIGGGYCSSQHTERRQDAKFLYSFKTSERGSEVG